MLVQEFSYYIYLVFWYVKLLVILSFPVLGYLIRRKWRFAVAKEAEVKRLILLAADEAARAEQEAAENGYYADVPVNRTPFRCTGEVPVSKGSFEYSHEVAEQAECAEVASTRVKALQCAVCLSPTTTRCSRCKSVRYCSAKCQIFHWREGHKDKCHPPSMVTQTCDADNYHCSKAFNQENEETFTDSVETEDRHLKQSGTHLGGNASCGVGPTEQLQGKSNCIKAKVLQEIKPSISSSSFSSAFSSDSSLSSAFSDSSDDTSTTERNSSSDPEKYDRRQHDVDDTSNQAKSAVECANKIKPCDLKGSTTAPSMLKTNSISPQHDDQKTSYYIPTLRVKSFDPLLAKSGQSDFWEGALDYRWSESVKTKSRTTNDDLFKISSSLSRTPDLYGKIDRSCHVNGKTEGSFSVINEPSDESASFKKADVCPAEVKSPVLLSSKIPHHAKDVDNSVFNISGDSKSKYSSSATVLSPPRGERLGDTQKASNFSLSSSKKANHTGNGTSPTSNSRRSSASNGEATVRSVKGDNACKTNGVSHSQSANRSSLFAKRHGHALNSNELDCTVQTLKSRLVVGLPSNSHETHPCVNGGGKIPSGGTKVDVVNSSNNVATSDKSYSLKVANGVKTSTCRAADHSKASKLSTRCASDERRDKKGVFSYELFKSLYGWNKVELQPCGLVNCGNSCYANVVLQCLSFTPSLTAYLLQGLHSKSCTKTDWCFICEFENLMVKAKDGTSPISPIGIISHLPSIGSHLSNGKEEDAHEFLRYVVDKMQSICFKEAISKVSGHVEEEATLISLAFGGYIQSKIRCMKCGNKSERSERIMDLSVEIEGNIGSLEDALSRFTSTEMLDGENKYNCARCKSYQKAKKKLTLLEAPNILTIALKRFQVGKFGKLSKWIDFPQILDIAPYMSGTTDDKAPVYDLYGVIVHLDTMNAAFSGHYVCYVRNSQKKWFKIDDSVVKSVSFSKVKEQSAYMLLYARCLPRAPGCLRDKLGGISKSKATPPLTGHSPVTSCPSSLNFDSITSPDVKFETDSYSDNNSLFSCGSDENSCSTDVSTRESNSPDDLSDLIFGGSGCGLRYPWKSSSDSNISTPFTSP
ncbi:unnamed protein product [Rhodiola kirilowii]